MMNSKMVSGGVQDSSLGIKYQLDILLLCAHQSVGESKIRYFQLSTEQVNVGKFDDIVLQIFEKGKPRYVFGQAKYKINPVKFDYNMFMLNNKFKLSKYFDSWREILSQKQYEKSEITILIITNNQLDTAQILQNGLVKIDSDDQLLSLNFIKDKSADPIFERVGKRYKFPDSAAFPAERQAVFQVLKNDFLKNNSGKHLSDFDLKLNSFMDRLVFVTSLEIKDIQELIQKDLQVKFKVKDVSDQYLKLEECIRNIVTGSNNKVQKITKNEYVKVFKEYELFEDKMRVIDRTKTIFENDSRLNFQINNKIIEDFLDTKINKINNILRVRTQASETEFVCMWIHSMLSTTADKDTYIVMKTSFSKENFDRGVKVFEAAESFKFMIVEVDTRDHLFGKYSNRLKDSLQNSSKLLIVITDVKSGVMFQNCCPSEAEVPHIYPKELSQGSLTEVLSRPVSLQNHQTTWKQIADEVYLKNEILLKDLLKANEIGENVPISKDFDVGLYVSRTFIYKNVLQSEALTECEDDQDGDDNDDELQLNPSKNIHLLESDGKNSQTTTTSGDSSKIVDFASEKKNQVKEHGFVSASAKISILIDIAGMGKTTLLNYLARELKKSRPNYWITKIELNDFTKELDQVTSKELETSQMAVKFVSNYIMKLKSKFDKDLFRESCESTGNVVLLFDGFDEVAKFYKDQVTQLVKSLLKTKIEKFFIASRPEWSDYLQRTFSQIKHALQPFKKEDQEHYLFNFLNDRIENVDEVKLKRIIETVLKLMSTSISDKDYKFTGVPLITKLVGEFFESKISEYFQASTEDFKVFIQKLEKETFDLIKLYDHFVEEKLQVYYEEKCGMILSNPQTSRSIKQMKQKILENYETLAVRQILKTDVENFFPLIAAKKLDKAELEDLVSIGLVYEVNNQWKFAHQTYAEYGFKKFLDKNFDDENCAKFIVEVVLIDRSYQVIRTFMNFWILEKVNEKTCAVYQKILLESSIESEGTPLHFAGREGNENLFCFFYSALAINTENSEIRAKIQNYLLKIAKNYYNSERFLYTGFVQYFRYCEDHLNILPKVQSDFGVEFLKKILTIQMGGEENLLQAICWNNQKSKNVLKVLNFLREYFSNDLKLLRQVFLLRNKDGGSFLHNAFVYLEIEILFCLFEELNSLKELLGQDFVNKLFLMKSRYSGVFLSRFAYTSRFSNDHFFSFLNQIKLLCDQETLKKIFFVVGDENSWTLLHDYCYYRTKVFDLLQVLQWVARELGKKVLAELILLKDKKNRTIFHCFTSENQSNSGSNFLSILIFLKNEFKFENDFLIEKILFTNDENGENVFSNLLEQNQEKEFYLNFLKFLAIELNLTEESLKNYLIQSEFLFRFAQIEEKQSRDELLNLFRAKFGTKNFDLIETFHRVCEKHSEDGIDEILNYLNLILEVKDFDFVKNYVSGKNSKKQTILFYFHHGFYPSKLIEILDWFETIFKNDENFLKNFLLQVDENLDSFLNFVLRKCGVRSIDDYFEEIYEFLNKNLDKVFVKELLLLQSKKGENFLNIVCERGDGWYVTEILDTLFKDFQNDQDFFAKLINEKSKKNRRVKDFMKNKFKKDLPEEQTRRSNSCEIS